MNIKEFAQELIDNTRLSAELTGADFDEELANTIIEYIVDTGEVNAPEICTFKKTRARITAYDYNDEAESLDLFYLERADTLIGKINNNKVEQGFNYLMRFYRDAMTGVLIKEGDEPANSEISQIVELIQSTKGKISQLRIFLLTDGLTDPSAVPSAVESDDEYVIEYNVF